MVTTRLLAARYLFGTALARACWPEWDLYATALLAQRSGIQRQKQDLYRIYSIYK